jgi:phosphoribosylamine--glycine ligase
MRVLIIGNGGREHALAWKAAQSPRLTRLFIAPGNGGTLQHGENVQIQAGDTAALVEFADVQRIDLVIIGPEIPLVGGLSDALQADGRRVFGPTRAAAEIEGSKSFAKHFMARHGIPTAHSESYDDFYQALGALLRVDFETGQRVVLKASGLAAGKGVVLPECADDAEAALRRMMLEHEFGSAGAEVLIEDRLQGEEVSLLAFTDGVHIAPMPPAQDHKRLLDGDQGPNTGGMGAYAPAPVCPPSLVREVVRTVLQPAVDGLRSEGRHFVGVLYAGLMLTPNGPRVLEFNCRFGDPETQAILPLLETDLLDVAEACCDGRLGELPVRWRAGSAACVVLAAGGYPGTISPGQQIHGLQTPSESAMVFQAGTQVVDGKTVTAGGRVLGVTGWGDELAQALERAYSAAGAIRFEGQHQRSDIGARATRLPA